MDLQTASKWLVCHILYIISICRALLGCKSCPTILAFVTAHGLIFMVLAILQMASNSLASLILLSAIFWALCTPTLHALVNTHSLMTSSMSPNVAASLNIPSVMSSSLCPPIHCLTIASHTLYICFQPLFFAVIQLPAGQTHYFPFVIFGIAMRLLFNCGLA